LLARGGSLGGFFGDNPFMFRAPVSFLLATPSRVGFVTLSFFSANFRFEFMLFMGQTSSSAKTPVLLVSVKDARIRLLTSHAAGLFW